MKRLGKKRRLSSLRSTSKEVEALYGSDPLGRSIANSTRMRIEEGIKSGKINTADEIDEIIENSRKDYRTSLEKREIKQKMKLQPKYKISHYKGSKSYIYDECNLQIFEDKVEVTYKDKKVKGSLKQMSWSIYFKGIDSIALINNRNVFEIKMVNGSEFRFIGGELSDMDYIKNLFNELELNFTDYKSKYVHILKEEQERKEQAERIKRERKEQAERVKREKERERKESLENFFSSDEYVLLQNFVKKYGPYFGNTSNPNLEKKIFDFKKLIETKGHIFVANNEIENLMIWELETQEYDDFKSKILYNQPNNDIKGYIKNFLDVYGENYTQYYNLFTKLLKENGITFDENLNALIETVIEEKKLEMLEKELSDFDNRDFIHNLDSLTGYEFEEFLRVLFDKMGFTTETTKLSGDQGADLIIKRFGRTTAVQAKRYTGKVSNKAIQEVTASIAHYNANNGMVVTTGEFTPSAIELAKSNNIKLVDRQKLEELVNKHY